MASIPEPMTSQARLKAPDLLPGQRMDLLTKLADCDLQTGNLALADAEFIEAKQICEQHPELSRWLSTIMSNLGRVKSMQGHLEEAENIYKDALN